MSTIYIPLYYKRFIFWYHGELVDDTDSLAAGQGGRFHDPPPPPTTPLPNLENQVWARDYALKDRSWKSGSCPHQPEPKPSLAPSPPHEPPILQPSSLLSPPPHYPPKNNTKQLKESFNSFCTIVYSFRNTFFRSLVSAGRTNVRGRNPNSDKSKQFFHFMYFKILVFIGLLALFRHL